MWTCDPLPEQRSWYSCTKGYCAGQNYVIESNGGRYWTRTSNPCDVKAGAAAQPSDFYKHGCAAGRRLRHQCASYVLVRWCNEPKSTVLRGGVSALCP
jgi:hypothetical protein